MNKLIKRISAALVVGAIALSALAFTTFAASSSTMDRTAKEITADMTIGWNLGNSLDATGGSGLSSETSWGNPKTTKAMIDKVKGAGFNTVRIPVSWGRHTSGSNFTIDSSWLSRVKEVVDYCIDNDMYVILNSHHDNDKKYYYPSSTYLSNSKNYMDSIWTQVANAFKNYDDRLVFESMNEPRLSGTSDEWWFPVNNPNSTVADSIKAINTLNQVMVNAVRKTGGNNAKRSIMVPGYAASIDGAVTSGFKLPTDTASNRLIVSVHAYTPYNFALNANGTSIFSDNLKSEVDYLFNTLNSKYVSKGIPVVLGETSASNKNNPSERIKWIKYYFGKAKQVGIPCMVWDNNVYVNNSNAGEAHGYLNRKTLQWYDSNIITTLMNTVGGTETPHTHKWVKTSSAASTLTAKGYTKYKCSGCNETKTVYIAKLMNIKSSKVILSAENLVYNGKSKKPTFRLVYNGKTLKNGTDYKLTFPSNTKTIGTKSVKITGLGKYGGSFSRNYYIVPDKVKVSVSASTATTATLKWNKVSGASRYAIYKYSSSSKKWSIVKTTTGTSYKLTGLSAGTTYKYRVRAYKTVSGKNHYSNYSLTLPVTTKPTQVKIKSFVSTKTKTVKAAWSKNKSATGYQVQISTSSKFSSGNKSYYISKNSTLSKTISKLTKNKTYHVRVRGYKLYDGTKHYGAWSTARKIKCK